MSNASAPDDTVNDEQVGTTDDPRSSAAAAAGFDDGAAPDTAAGDSAESDIRSVEDRISELELDLTSERDKLLRLAAEFDNYRKRMMRDRLEAEARGKAELVKEILEPMDDIARFAHVDPAVTDSRSLVEGVEMVERKLEKTLRTAGLEVVNPIDEPFDPARHEAVGTEPADSPELDHTVSRVYQVGYTFRGQLLRPARVVVRQFTLAE
jgi:molecular chaperone GrpE